MTTTSLDLGAQHAAARCVAGALDPLVTEITASRSAIDGALDAVRGDCAAALALACVVVLDQVSRLPIEIMTYATHLVAVDVTVEATQVESATTFGQAGLVTS